MTDRPAGEPVATPILHVDMDAFFASCELRRHPELVGQPVVVGGSGERGVVAAASYEARAYGVHSAMPAVRARRLCPHAVFLPGDHAHYSEVSGRIMEVFREATPLVEPLSLDEAFLDVGGSRRLLGAPSTIAAEIRRRVFEQEGLTCSVGVARVKFLAKLASQAAKPRAGHDGTRPGPGVLVVDPGDERSFLHPLPVQALWGVGPATLAKLQRIGIRTVGDLAATSPDALAHSIGKAAAAHLHALANLVDPRPVVPDLELKSVSHEETFGRDKHRAEDLAVELRKMGDAVGARLRASGLTARTVTIKVRFGDFSTISRSATLDEPTDSGVDIVRVGRELLAQVDPSPGVRLLGIGVTKLGPPAARQLRLDLAGTEPIEDPNDEEHRRVEAVVDLIRDRYGSGSVGPASLVGPTGLRSTRKGTQQWGPDVPTP